MMSAREELGLLALFPLDSILPSLNKQTKSSYVLVLTSFLVSSSYDFIAQLLCSYFAIQQQNAYGEMEKSVVR
jgi:hypothetical protein